MAKSPLSVGKFRYTFFVWWLAWTTLHVIAIMNFGFSLRIALIDSLATNIPLLILCWFMGIILQYYLPRKERHWYILILGLGLSALIVAVAKGLARYFLSGQEEQVYLAFFSNSFWIRFSIAFLLIVCIIILYILWYTLGEEEENRQRKTDAERLTKEAELYKLRQQLQPHFLFNSLNSISALVGSKPEQARTMIQQLSDFLRGTLRKEDQQWVNLKEELQLLELYLEIEKVRFGYRLNTIVEKDEACNDMKLPPLLLQPIVENAIKFGLYDTTESVTISIAAKAANNELLIIVKNPFDPETASPRQGTGFGLSSVKRRLYLLFARNDLLETNANDNLFTTTVKIPQTYEGNNNR